MTIGLHTHACTHTQLLYAYKKKYWYRILYTANHLVQTSAQGKGLADRLVHVSLVGSVGVMSRGSPHWVGDGTFLHYLHVEGAAGVNQAQA